MPSIVTVKHPVKGSPRSNATSQKNEVSLAFVPVLDRDLLPDVIPRFGHPSDLDLGLFPRPQQEVGEIHLESGFNGLFQARLAENHPDRGFGAWVLDEKGSHQTLAQFDLVEGHFGDGVEGLQGQDDRLGVGLVLNGLFAPATFIRRSAFDLKQDTFYINIIAIYRVFYLV